VVRRARVVFTILCAASAACALVTDLSDLSSDAGTVDAGDGCDAAGACSNAKVPASWTAVAFHESFIGCPEGFTSQTFVTNPVASCACGCNVTAQPDCTTGSVPTAFGTTSTCSQVGITDVVDGGCQTIAGTISNYFSGTPIAPTGATCTSQAKPDASTTSAEACIPTRCGDSICQGVVPQGFKACIITLGDQPCPSGTPFTVATSVGASADVTCGSGCTCAVSAACQSAMFTFYTDTACNTPLTTVAVNSTCVSTNEAAGTTLNSLKYTATPSASCATGGTSKPDASLVDRRTVCCAP
jgi:hypothetical protein